jgi:hypothetical protein
MQTTLATPSPGNDPAPNPGQQPQPPGLPEQPGDPVQESLQALYSLGFTAKEHYALAQKLLADPPTEDFDRVVRLPAGKTRERHLWALNKLIKRVRSLDGKADACYLAWRSASTPAIAAAQRERLELIEVRLRALYPRFRFRWTMCAEMAVVANCIDDAMQTLLAQGAQQDESAGGTTRETRMAGPTENGAGSGGGNQLLDLELLARMPAPEYREACARLRRASDAVLLARTSRRAPGAAT